MRGMNLPPLPPPPSTIDECRKLYMRRLEHGGMPFPEASQLLVAYMAWPNDRKNRDRWMATPMAFFIAEQSVKSSPEPGRRSLPPEYSAFEPLPGVLAHPDAS